MYVYIINSEVYPIHKDCMLSEMDQKHKGELYLGKHHSNFTTVANTWHVSIKEERKKQQQHFNANKLRKTTAAPVQ